MKNFCFVKGNVKRIKRQATNWEKIFAKDISNKELLSKTYIELLKVNNKKTNKLIKNGLKTLTDTSPKKTYDGKWVYEKMLHVICHQGNTN